MDKRILKNQESTKNLFNLLVDIAKNPENFPFETFEKTLKSQGGISKIKDTERGITPSSINTLKRISTEIFNNGFEEIDTVRKMAYESLLNHQNNQSIINKKTKTGLSNKVEDLEEKILMLQQAHLLCINTIMENLKVFKNITTNNSPEAIAHLSQSAIQRIQSLSLISPLFLDVNKESNVINIKDFNNEKK